MLSISYVISVGKPAIYVATCTEARGLSTTSYIGHDRGNPTYDHGIIYGYIVDTYYNASLGLITVRIYTLVH